MSLNLGFITWIIKKDDLAGFHNSQVGESICSEEVTSAAQKSMHWHLRCYPNGSKHKFEGWVGLSLALTKSSIPSNVSTILVRYYLYESQSSSICRGVARFNPTHSTGYAKSNGTNYLVALQQLKQYDIIILKCELQIIRMYQLHRVIHGGALKLNKILCYEWNICDKALEQFKSIAPNNPFSRLYSDEFNIWSLVLVPSTTTVNSQGNVSLRLRLHELPPNVQAVQIALVLSCPSFDRSWSTICHLSYDNPWVPWPSNTLKKAMVDARLNPDDENALKALSFECRIEIISMTMHEWKGIEHLNVRDTDSKYKQIWNEFIMDENNVFMQDTAAEHVEHKQLEADDDDEMETRVEAVDEHTICQKEDLIRLDILKSLDLGDKTQKDYVMNCMYSMAENVRVLRRDKQENKDRLNELESVVRWMQNEMKIMQQQYQDMMKQRHQEKNNEKFIKRMKKQKAKRDKQKKQMEAKEKENSKEQEKVNEKKTKKQVCLTAKQQLFKTWMDCVVHMPQYFQMFVDTGYDDLTNIEAIHHEQDLIEIGVTKRGHRQKILQEIKKLKPKKEDKAKSQHSSIDSNVSNTNNAEHADINVP
eukprot:251498_1